MKKGIYFFVFFLICFSACRKKDKGGENSAKHCNYALFAFKNIGNNNYRIVSIDTGTGKISDIPAFKDVRGYLGCLNRAEKCYYMLQVDDNGFLNLTKMDLGTKKTIIYNGPRFSSGFTQLSYSKPTGKFYSVNMHNSHYAFDWSFYEITISSDTLVFNDIYFSDKGFLVHQIVSNEQNGDLYFSAGDGLYTFNPETRAIAYNALPLEKNKKLELTQYNTKDGYLYAIYGDFATGTFLPQAFQKVNPRDGAITTISSVLPPSLDGMRETTIGACGNCYIIRTDEIANTSLYWLDVKSGAVTKKLTLDEQVFNIMCVDID